LNAGGDGIHTGMLAAHEHGVAPGATECADEQIDRLIAAAPARTDSGAAPYNAASRSMSARGCGSG